MLPLTFVDKGDYHRITSNYTASTLGLRELAPGRPLRLRFSLLPGKEGAVTGPRDFDVEAQHTMSLDQIEWFRAGSALNLIAAQQKTGN